MFKLHTFVHLDIGECDPSSPTKICGNHTCENTEGDYNCVCNAGYENDGDNHSCTGTTLISKYLILFISIFSALQHFNSNENLNRFDSFSYASLHC